MIVQTLASHLNSALSDMQQHTQHVTALQQRVQSQLAACERVLKTDTKSVNETDSDVVHHMNTLTDIGMHLPLTSFNLFALISAHVGGASCLRSRKFAIV
jgi:hypothetical protein